jgi:hypothetical protein
MAQACESCCCLVALVTLAFGWAGLPGPAGRDVPSPTPLPAGVADPAGKVGFVMSRSGGIDALDLASGRTLWSNPRGGRPLIAWGERLAVLVRTQGQPTQLRVLVLDAAHEGRPVLESEPLPLPAWVAAAGPVDGDQFRVWPAVKAGALNLTWAASQRREYGVDPRALPNAPGAQGATGTVRIVLASGRVAEVPAAESPAPGKPKPPENLADVVSHPYREGGRFCSDPLVVGDSVLALEKPAAKPALVLKRWDRQTGREEAAVELGPPGPAAPLLTLDGSHLLVVAKPGGAGETPRDRVVALPAGRVVAELPVGPDVRAASVLGGRAYVAAEGPAGAGQSRPWVLRAYALAGGKLLWEHPILGGRAQSTPPRRP